MIGCRMGRAVRWAMGAALLACAVRASDAVEDGVLTLDVSDAGRTLQAALAARSLALADLSSVTSLVIDCVGVVTSDVALAGWSGDLRIRPQSVFEVTADGALGTADGAIFIEDGGQLKMSVMTKATWKQTKKTCYFEGEGPDGNGALYSISAQHEVENCLWPYNLVMTGDALWKAANNYQMDVNRGTLDMNGHTLRYGVSGRFDNIQIKHPGHIVHFFGGMLIQGGCDFGGGDTNTITVQKGATMRQWGGPGVTPWTAIFKPGSSLYPGAGSGNQWQGPVVLEEMVPMERWTEWPGMTFYGPVSGPGGIFSANKGVYGERMTLRFVCPTNNFRGGVALRECVLDLPVDGALPADGAALVMTNSSVTLSAGVAYDLPSAVFSGTGTVVRGSGAWRGSVTKEEAGELVYASGVGADLLDVKGGSVRFACDDKGLYRGIEVGTAADNTALALFASDACPSNGWAAFPEYSYPAMNSSWKNYMCVVYTGYLWNRSGADAVWTFGACIDDRARLIINGETVLDCTAWNDLKFAQATLRPGANRFEWRLCNDTGPAGGSNGGGTLNWEAAKGLAYHVGATDSKDPADFTAFTADDVGTLFTFTDGTVESRQALLPVFGTVRLAAGTTLDLGGVDYTVKAIGGVGTVAGGPLMVTERLVAPAAALKAGGVLTVEGTLAFGAGCVLDVDEPETLTHVNELVVATAGAIAGRPALSPALKAANWIVVCADGKVTLRRSGFAIIFR